MTVIRIPFLYYDSTTHLQFTRKIRPTINRANQDIELIQGLEGDPENHNSHKLEFWIFAIFNMTHRKKKL